MKSRTKLWLNNPIAIGSLCAVAAGLVYWNIAPLLFSNNADLDASDIVEEDDWLVEEERIEETRLELRSVNARMLQWNETPARDPFTLTKSSGRPGPIQTLSSSDTSAVVTKGLPVLNALVASSRFRYAVIDGEIVAEGDRLNDFTVDSISPQGVRLITHGEEPIHLTVNRP